MERQAKIDIIKKHINNIINEEQKKCKNSPEFFILDRKSFFEDSKIKRLNNKYNLIRNNPILEKSLGYTGYLDLSKHMIYSIAGGFTNGKGITILLNRNTFTGEFNRVLYFEILAAFHEFKHVFQEEKYDVTNIENPITNFNHFRYFLEMNCHRYLPAGYYLMHDDFYFEIDANLYGIEKADEYCFQNGISADDFQKKYKQKHYSKMLTYDFNKFLYINKFLSINPRFKKILSQNPTYNLFFKKDGSFNKLSDILKSSLFFSLDDKLKMEIFTSDTFFSSINYNLDDIETSFLLKNIDNKINDLVASYNQNKEFYKNGVFDYDTFIENSIHLLSKIENILSFKLQCTKEKYIIDDSVMELRYQIEKIRTNCDLKHGYSLSYDSQDIMNNQLDSIISKFTSFIADRCNLDNIQMFLSYVKILREAILAKIDVNSMAVDAQYEIISKEDAKKDMVQKNIETPQFESSKVRKKTKGNILFELIFIVNIFLSILITISYLINIYK